MAQEDFKKGLIVNPDNTIDVSFEGNGSKDSASRADHYHSYEDIVGAPSFGDAPLTFSAVQDGVGLQISTREGKDVIDVRVGNNGIIINELGEVDLDNAKLPKGNYDGTAGDLKVDVDSKLSKSTYTGTAKDLDDAITIKLNKGSYNGTAQTLKEEIDGKLSLGGYVGTAHDLDLNKTDSGGYNGTSQDLKNEIDKKLNKDELPQLPDNIATKEDIYSLMPIGTVISIGHNEVPLGFLLCDGRAISQSEYPELYRLYGSNIPDYRNMFLRGNTAGREIGSLQGDAIRNITGVIENGHGDNETGVTLLRGSSGAFYSETTMKRAPTSQGSMSVTELYRTLRFDASRVVPTADENRPKNISVNYIIKAQNIVAPSSAVNASEELNRKIEQQSSKTIELTEVVNKNKSEQDEKIITTNENIEKTGVAVSDIDNRLYMTQDMLDMLVFEMMSMQAFAMPMMAKEKQEEYMNTQAIYYYDRIIQKEKREGLQSAINYYSLVVSKFQQYKEDVDFLLIENDKEYIIK